MRHFNTKKPQFDTNASVKQRKSASSAKASLLHKKSQFNTKNRLFNTQMRCWTDALLCWNWRVFCAELTFFVLNWRVCWSDVFCVELTGCWSDVFLCLTEVFVLNGRFVMLNWRILLKRSGPFVLNWGGGVKKSSVPNKRWSSKNHI